MATFPTTPAKRGDAGLPEFTEWKRNPYKGRGSVLAPIQFLKVQGTRLALVLVRVGPAFFLPDGEWKLEVPTVAYFIAAGIGEDASSEHHKSRTRNTIAPAIGSRIGCRPSRSFGLCIVTDLWSSSEVQIPQVNPYITRALLER